MCPCHRRLLLSALLLLVMERPLAAQQRVDPFGDALPAGALTRFGTVRFRTGHSAAALALSPDHTMLAAVGADAVLLWDVANGKPLRSWREPWVGCVVFAPDGKTLLTGNGIGMLHRWDVQGKALWASTAHQGRVTAVAFSPEGDTIGSASTDGTLRLREAATGKELRQLGGQARVEIPCLAFAPDGKTLVAASERLVRRWEVPSGKEIEALSRPAAVYAVAFSADARTLAVAGADKVVALCAAATGKEFRRLEGHQGPIRTLAFSGDGAVLVSGSVDGTTCVWDVTRGERVRRLTQAQGGGTVFALAADGKVLAVAGPEQAVRLWNMATGAERPVREGHTGALCAAVLVSDGKMLVSAAADGSVRAWDVSTGRELRTYDGPQPAPVLLAASPDGKTLAAASAGTIHLWEAGSGQALQQLPGPADDPIQCLTFAPDGKRLALGSRHGTLRLWQPSAPAPTEVPGPIEGIFSISYSPDGKTLAVVGGDRLVRLLDTHTSKELRRWGSVSLSAPVVFAPDGKLLAAGNADGIISLWDVASGKEARQLNGHDDLLDALAFSADGRILASGGHDGLVRLWEVASAKEVLQLPGHLGPVIAVTFSTDSRTVFSASTDTTLLAWDATGRFKDGRPVGSTLAATELDALWQDLLGTDGPAAYRAVWTLTEAPKQAVPSLQERLRPFLGIDARRIARLIEALDHDEFAVREKATEDLERLGQLAESALSRTLADTPSVEVRRRIEHILEKLKGPVSWPQEKQRLLRVLLVLEKIDTPESRQVLESVVRGGPEADLIQEAKASLDRLKAGVRK